jgi:hypothetical protein
MRSTRLSSTLSCCSLAPVAMSGGLAVLPKMSKECCPVLSQRAARCRRAQLEGQLALHCHCTSLHSLADRVHVLSMVTLSGASDISRSMSSSSRSRLDTSRRDPGMMMVSLPAASRADPRWRSRRWLCVQAAQRCGTGVQAGAAASPQLGLARCPRRPVTTVTTACLSE